MRRSLVVVLVALSMCGESAAWTMQHKENRFAPHISLNILDEPHPVDLAFDVGAFMDIVFQLGPVGEFRYSPGFGLWLGGDDQGDWDYFAMQLYFDVGDARYVFPLPDHVPVKPYVGLGPNITVDIYHRDFEGSYPNPHPDWEETDVDPEPGFNFFVGANFEVSRAMNLFGEFRYKAGDWDVFKIMAGLSFGLGRY